MGSWMFELWCDVTRGVYLATVFYHKENVLVTAEDQIPLVEIQCCSTSITQDFLWFAKVMSLTRDSPSSSPTLQVELIESFLFQLSCAWQQVPWLQQALSSAHSSPSSLLQNRHNILRAVSQMQVGRLSVLPLPLRVRVNIHSCSYSRQSSLGTVDLGQVYYEPLKDRQGNVLLVTLKEFPKCPW